MADITVTAANVVAPSGQENIRVGTAGEAITAGQSVYIDTADSDKIKLADNNASAATATAAGVSVTGAGNGEPVVYAIGGDYDTGGTVVKGGVYVVSATAGGIAPEADLASGNYTSVLGVASSTSNITIKINNSGITTT